MSKNPPPRDEFSIRITTKVDEEFGGKFAAFLMNLGGVTHALACKEIGSETQEEHVHAFIKTNEKHHDSNVRYHIDKIWKFTGDNNDKNKRSCKDPNSKNGSTEKCLNYICKGVSATDPPEVVYMTWFNACDVEMYHRNYWAVHAECSKYVHAKKKGRPGIYDTLSDYCLTKECNNEEDVINACMEWYKSVKRHVHSGTFIHVIRKLTCEYDPESAIKMEQLLRNYLWDKL